MKSILTSLCGILLTFLVAEASVAIVESSRKALPKDPFYAPPLGSLADLTSGDVGRLRYRTQSGRVLAVWRKNNLMIRTRGGEYLRVRLRIPSSLPMRGDSIEVVGRAEFDGLRINLSDALWRSTPDLGIGEEPTISLSGSDLLKSGSDDVSLRTDLYGRRLTLAGIVHAPSCANDDTLFYLENAEHLLSVDISGCPNLRHILQPGSRVAITGICLIEVGTRKDQPDTPRVHGAILLPGEPSDVFLIAKASWWTPTRFWVLVALLATLLFIFILRMRRLQALTKANRLKVEERTRLAVELHDTLSQSLAGISLELAAAGESPHIERASRALNSARTELRNCLWDLRSRTFDETDMRDAVLKTLVPVIDESRLRIRFSIPRENLSENSAHTLLCAIRELVANALTHGKASSVRIAGTMKSGQVMCSVTDNGCGFDPKTVPGVNDGHFGLQGVRERIMRIGGTLEVDSFPGHGTKITFTLPADNPKVHRS